MSFITKIVADNGNGDCDAGEDNADVIVVHIKILYCFDEYYIIILKHN